MGELEKDFIAATTTTEKATTEDLAHDHIGSNYSQESNVSLQRLNNKLEEIIDEQKTRASITNPESLGLEYLKADDYGLYVEIPEEYKNRINRYQADFIPSFESVREKYSAYPEFSYYNTEKPFVFSPYTIQVMSNEILPNLLNETEKLFLNGNSVEGNRILKWEESNIDGILNKLLALESYRLERIMAPRARDYIAEAFPNEGAIKVKELCTGAGITTALMYEALSETGKNIQMHTADNSLQSVMCAATLLTLRNIPTRVVLDNNIPEKDFKGVTIYFESALDSISKDGQYHFVLSDNGINYFDEKDHYEVVEKIISKMLPGALFQDCTLDPNIQVDLSTMSMFKQVFSRKRNPLLGDEMYALKKGDSDKMYITQLFSPSSTMQYELLNVLLKEKGPDAFWQYLMGAKKAGEITKTLAPKIAQDIRKTKDYIKTLVKGEMVEYPTYEEQPHSLTRFIEFKLPKENVME